MKKIFKYCWLLITLVALFSGCQKEVMLSVGHSKSYSISSTYTASDYNLEILYPEKYDPLLEYHIVYLLV